MKKVFNSSNMPILQTSRVVYATSDTLAAILTTVSFSFALSTSFELSSLTTGKVSLINAGTYQAYLPLCVLLLSKRLLVGFSMN